MCDGADGTLTFEEFVNGAVEQNGMDPVLPSMEKAADRQTSAIEMSGIYTLTGLKPCLVVAAYGAYDVNRHRGAVVDT